MRLSKLKETLHAQLIGADAEFERLSTDSRSIIPGGVFVALRGDNFDGHEFVMKAEEGGACALVVDAEQSNVSIPQLVVQDTLIALGQIAAQKRKLFKGQVVAVTGSSGKTTVKGMLAKVFSSQAKTVSTQGNFNNYVGVPLTLMQMSDEQYAVVELGTSHPGEIEYLSQLIDPDIALVTNVMAAHIGGFGCLDDISKEKGSVYASANARQAIINLDDAYADEFIKRASDKKIIGFSLKERNKNTFPVVYAESIDCCSRGLASFDICFEQSRVHIKLSVPGLHNVSNALAVTACALACGMNLDCVVHALSEYKSGKGRMCELEGLNGANIIDDSYNANPGSVRAAIDTLSLFSGKRILVLGDMGELGNLGAHLHEEVGLYAASKGIDRLYTFGPLSELAAKCFGGFSFSFTDKLLLVDALKKELEKNTTVLVKGSRSTKMEEVSLGVTVAGLTSSEVGTAGGASIC